MKKWTVKKAFRALFRGDQREPVLIEGNKMKKLTMLLMMAMLVACGKGNHSAPVEEAGQGVEGPVVVSPGPDKEDEMETCIPEGMPLVDFAEIKQVLFDVSCAQCHSAAAGSIAGINTDQFINVSRDLERIVASIESGSMPPNGPLSEDQRNTLAAWQNVGAPENRSDIVVCD